MPYLNADIATPPFLPDEDSENTLPPFLAPPRNPMAAAKAPPLAAISQAPPPPQGPPAGPDYSGLEAKLGQRPTLEAPKWWQRALAGGAGALAGWSNAAGRTRQPIDIGAMQSNIMHPGYTEKQAEFESQVKPQQDVATLKGQQVANWYKNKQLEAQAEYEKQHGAYFQHRAELEQNQWKLDPKTGTLYNTVTGERSQPPADPQQRYDAALKITGDKDMAGYYALNGNLGGYGATLDKGRTENEWDTYLKAAGGDPNKALAMRRAERIAIAQGSRSPASSTTVNISPEALDQAAKMYSETGQMPSVGFGKDAATMRSQIMNRAAKINPDADLANAKAEYGARTGATRQISQRAAMARTAESTAQKNLDLADSVSKRVDRTGSPVLNRLLLHIKGQYAGDTDTQLLANAIETATNEYASVVSGANSGTTTDRAKEHAMSMLNQAMGKGTFSQVIQQMKREMENRRTSYEEELKSIRGGQPAGQPMQQQAAPVGQNPNPNGYVSGHRYGGMTYVGGDPNNRASWK